MDIQSKIKEECLQIVDLFMNDFKEGLIKGSYETKGVKLLLNEYIADLIGKSEKSKKHKELNRMIKEHNKKVNALNAVIRKKLFLKNDNFILLVNGNEQEKMNPETRGLQLKAYEITIATMKEDVAQSETRINEMKLIVHKMIA